MKKIIIITVILLAVGYLVYQNGSLWLLKLMAMTSSPGGNGISSAGTSIPKPPYKNGIYTGNAADAFYGTIQVKAVVSNRKLADVQFLQYPNDRTRSIAINTLAMPNLQQEAISAQSANVDIVSGATDSSNAFIQSLASALSQAK